MKTSDLTNSNLVILCARAAWLAWSWICLHDILGEGTHVKASTKSPFLYVWGWIHMHIYCSHPFYCSFWYHVSTNMLFFNGFLQPNSRINSSNLSSCWATSRILHVLYRKIVSFSCIWCERLSHQRNHATIWQPLWGWGPMWWTVCALKATHPLDLESGQGE